MLSNEQIKVIRDSVDLSKIISRNVKLQKRGNNLIGLCPFHNEKTPSFNVNDEEGFYHCFGCGAHGDVISFIRNFEGKSFIEALETVADTAGLKIPSSNLKNENIISKTTSIDFLDNNFEAHKLITSIISFWQMKNLRKHHEIQDLFKLYWGLPRTHPNPTTTTT